MPTSNLNTNLDLGQPLAVFLQGLNWDNRPSVQTFFSSEVSPEFGASLLLAQSVGQFFAGCNWSGIRLRPEPPPELPPEDPFTLEDFATLFGGALL